MRKIRTVLGDIPPAEIGFTLMHEHLIADKESFNAVMSKSIPKYLFGNSAFLKGVDVKAEKARRERLNLNNYPKQSIGRVLIQNLRKPKDTDSDMEYMTKEVAHYVEHDGRTIVDATPSTLAIPTSQIVELSRENGVNIVISAGFYTESSFSEEKKRKDEKYFINYLENRIENGDGTSDARPGFIKCAANFLQNNEIAPIELTSIRACAKTAKEHGMSLHIHVAFPLREFHIMQIADIVQKEVGMDPQRVLILHMDCFCSGTTNPSIQITDSGYNLYLFERLLDRGFNLGLDTWGAAIAQGTPETKAYEILIRKRMLTELIGMGYLPQLTLGHDFSSRNVGYQRGNGGYTTVIQALRGLEQEGVITSQIVRTLTEETPARILSF